MKSDSQLGTFSREVASHLPCAVEEARWYATYTCANHEKTVTRQMALRGIESFLPLYNKISRWKDRRVAVQLPLFSGYVFVRMALKDKLNVLQIPGVVRLVGFNGVPAPLSDKEMESMRNGLTGDIHAEPCPYLRNGYRVRVKSGPMAGFQGILIRRKANYRLVLSIELIQRSITVDVDMADIDPCPLKYERLH